MSVIDMNTFNALKEAAGADFIGELIDTFLEDTPGQITTMRNALAAQDEKLNENGYIIPGLGDAGDRIFGTK